MAQDMGYQVADVLVDGVSVGAVYSYTFNNVTADHTISVTFKTPVITASAGANGSISPSGAVSVPLFGSQTFNMAPDMGYQVADVLVDGVSVGAVYSYTFNNVTADHTISASFAINTFTITGSAGTGGSISPSGTVTVNSGASQTFSITPNAGYQIADVLVDGSSVGAVSSYTFTNVTTNHSVSATFTQLSSITVTVPNGGESWKRGTTQTIRWTYAGNPGSSVKIELLKNGAVNKTITSSTSIGSGGSGSFNWTIANNQAAGTNYTVRITSTSNGSYTDTSNGNFSITK